MRKGEHSMYAVGNPALRESGFTLIELMIVVVVVAILMAVSYPNYTNYVVRSSREAAQSELVQLSGIQEKIFLNSSAFSSSVTSAYNGTSAGGLGLSSSKTSDRKYDISASVSGQTYTLTAVPVTGSSQASDGTITIDSTGARLRNGAAW